MATVTKETAIFWINDAGPGVHPNGYYLMGTPGFDKEVEYLSIHVGDLLYSRDVLLDHWEAPGFLVWDGEFHAYPPSSCDDGDLRKHGGWRRPTHEELQNLIEGVNPFAAPAAKGAERP